MKSFLKAFVSIILCLSLMLGVVVTSTVAENAAEKPTLKILAIGNSYTNNSTQYISKIAESMGLDIKAASLYKDGCMLHQHIQFYKNYETMGHDAYYAAETSKRYIHLSVNGVADTSILSIQEAIASDDWDFIVMHQAPNSCDDLEKYWTEENPDLVTLYNYIQTELDKNNNTKCEIVLNQGWSFSHEMSINNNYKWYPVNYENTRDFFLKIEETVAAAAAIVQREANLDAPLDIIPSGEAMQLAKDEFGFGDTFGSADSLYNDFISHLSDPIGCYMIANLWIEKFTAKAGFPVDCRNATYLPTGLSAENATILRSIAHEVISDEADTIYGDWRAIPDGDGLKITHYVGKVPATGTVTVPALLGEKPVTAIGKTTFKYVAGVTGVVTISNGVKIEEGALDGIKVLPTFWDGTSVKPTVGTGEPTDPYIITNAAQLDWAVKNSNKDKYFKLANDIYINDIAVDVSTGRVAGKENAIKWHDSTENTAFNGHLDGDNHIVSGLYIDYTYTGTDEAWTLGFGLIPNGGAFTVKNIGVVNSYVNAAGACASALVGEAGSTGLGYVVENSFVGEDVYLSGAAVGGVIGSGGCSNAGKTFAITNVYSLATISATTEFYGNITGQVWSTTAANSPLKVTNCYALDRLYGQAAPVCTDCYAGSNKNGAAVSGITLLTAENMQGEKSSVNMSKLWKNYVVTDTYPVLKSFTGRSQDAWSGFRVSAMEGDGSPEVPYLVATPENLAHIAFGAFVKDKYYKLTKDLYLNDIDKIDFTNGAVSEDYHALEWQEGKTFTAKFDGDGHIVYGMWYPAGNNINTASYVTAGLFGTLGANTTIKNLGIRYAYVDTVGYAGAVAAFANQYSPNTLIDSCFSDETVTVNTRTNTAVPNAVGSSGILGGVLFASNTKISNCYSLANVIGNYSNSKILASIWLCKGGVVLENCFADGELHSGDSEANSVDGVVNSYCPAATDAYKKWTQISDSEMKGAKALDRMPLGDAFAAVAKNYPMPKIFVGDAEAPDKSFWDGAYVKPTKGSGTTADPYLISTPEEFAYIVYNGGTANTYYKLTADIYLNRLDKINWSTGALLDENYPANEWFTSYTTGGDSYFNGINEITFSGIVDGDGHAVHGMYYAPGQPGTCTGLIPAVKKATIKNLALKDSFVSGGRWTGALVGATNGSGDVLTVDTVLVDSTVKVLDYNSGNYYYDGRTGSDILKASSPFSGVVANGVGFESCAAGGIVAYVDAYSTCNITNTAVYAKFDGTSCTAAYANPYSNGGNPVRVRGNDTIFGLMGTCWNPTALNFSNCIVDTIPLNNGNGALVSGAGNGAKPNLTMSNVYNVGAESTRDGVVNIEKPSEFVGPTALELAPELSEDVWYAVDNGGKLPSLRVIGTTMGDVDEDSEFTLKDDSAALRVVIIKNTAPSNGDFNKDEVVDILDLVALQLK